MIGHGEEQHAERQGWIHPGFRDLEVDPRVAGLLALAPFSVQKLTLQAADPSLRFGDGIVQGQHLHRRGGAGPAQRLTGLPLREVALELEQGPGLLEGQAGLA